MHKVHKVAAIVDDNVRSNFKNAADMCLILLRSRVIPSENVKSCLNKGCGNVILS